MRMRPHRCIHRQRRYEESTKRHINLNQAPSFAQRFIIPSYVDHWANHAVAAHVCESVRVQMHVHRLHQNIGPVFSCESTNIHILWYIMCEATFCQWFLSESRWESMEEPQRTQGMWTEIGTKWKRNLRNIWYQMLYRKNGRTYFSFRLPCHISVCRSACISVQSPDGLSFTKRWKTDCICTYIYIY